jgi:hypothetical protein
MATLKMTSGITHKDRLKRTTAITVGQAITDQGNCPGGAALSESKFDEWLSVTDRPAQTEPDKEAQSEFLVARPNLCPDSKITGSDLVFLDPQIGQLQFTGMTSAARLECP